MQGLIYGEWFKFKFYEDGRGWTFEILECLMIKMEGDGNAGGSKNENRL